MGGEEGTGEEEGMGGEGGTGEREGQGRGRGMGEVGRRAGIIMVEWRGRKGRKVERGEGVDGSMEQRTTIMYNIYWHGLATGTGNNIIKAK